MKRILSLILPFCICCCTQNQLILDPFDKGECLMIEDTDLIEEFEQIMEGIAVPENEYKEGENDNDIFDSHVVLSTHQYTVPALGICRTGSSEYYYHIERDRRGTLITDLDKGITDYIVSPEKYRQITDFVKLHTPDTANNDDI